MIASSWNVDLKWDLIDGIPGTKKPAGTADDVKKHFGCDPSLLIMVCFFCWTLIKFADYFKI